MSNDELKRGALFNNTKRKSDKSPDIQGDLEISRDLLKELIALATAGQPIKMRMAGYRKRSDKVGEWFSIWASSNSFGDRPAAPPPPPPPSSVGDPFGDDALPF